MSAKIRHSVDFETTIIDRFFRPLARHGLTHCNQWQYAPGLDLRDDCAELPPLAPDQAWVVTVDNCYPGIHYLDDGPGKANGRQVAARAILRNLSDLAAAGARPRFWFCAITFPAKFSSSSLHQWLTEFCSSAGELQDSYQIVLLGGDITIVDSNLRAPIVTITAIGEVNRRRHLLRRNARPGDLCAVSGKLGDAVLGLRQLKRQLPNSVGLTAAEITFIINSYQRPNPPIQLGQQLGNIRAAAIDISDGLLLDASRLAQAAGLVIAIDIAKIPKSSAVNKWLDFSNQDAAPWLAGGDDYQLLFTCSAQQMQKLTQTFPITIIGECRAGAPGIELANQQLVQLPTVLGFSHQPSGC